MCSDRLTQRIDSHEDTRHWAQKSTKAYQGLCRLIIYVAGSPAMGLSHTVMIICLKKNDSAIFTFFNKYFFYIYALCRIV